MVSDVYVTYMIQSDLLLHRIFFESAYIKFSKWGKIDFSWVKLDFVELHSENGGK